MSVSLTVLCTYHVPSIRTKTKSMKLFLQNNFKFMLKITYASSRTHTEGKSWEKKKGKT